VQVLSSSCAGNFLGTFVRFNSTDITIFVQYHATYDSDGTITGLSVTRLAPCAVASASLEALNKAATTGSLCPSGGFVNAHTMTLIGSGSAFDLGNDVTVDHFCVALLAANLQVSTLTSSCSGNTFGTTVRLNSTTATIVVQYHAIFDSDGTITGVIKLQDLSMNDLLSNGLNGQNAISLFPIQLEAVPIVQYNK
jgi:hypothetical protein